MVPRVVFTPKAVDLLCKLKAENGPLMFHQSGGCCDGSAPMCFAQGEFRIGQNDVLLGVVEDAPFYIGGQQYEFFAHTQLTIDVVPGRADSFSLEAMEGVRFITRSRVFTDEEAAELDAQGPPPRGPDALPASESA